LPVVVLGLVLAIAARSSPTASSSSAPPAAAKDGSGTYRRPLGQEPATLDPARISDVYSRSVAEQLFDGLVRFDQTLTISPGLAQHWRSSRDGLTWTFTLRSGVRFHHGREVTADDVVFSLSRLLDPRLKSGAADSLLHIKGAPEFRDGRAPTVAGLVALNPQTVQVTLTEVTVPLVSALAVGHARIVPRDLVESQGEAFGQHPVGTGPFKFVRWDRGKEIVVAANPDHFDGAPRLARVVFRIFAGNQVDAMYEEFQRGALEDSPVPNRDYRRAVAEQSAMYVKRPMSSVRFYGFNVRSKPLDDRRVRQAIVHAVDRDALIDEVFLGRYLPARGIIPPGTMSYNPALRGYAHSTERARDLLARAGYPGGRGLPPIVFWSSARHEGILREHAMIKRELEVVGVRAEFNYQPDFPAFLRMLGEGKAPVFLHAWHADVPDPDNFLYRLFYSKSPRNYSAYSNPVVDDLLLRARREPDAVRRVELFRQSEQLILDDAPLLPVFHYTYERFFQRYVKSVEVNGLGDPYIPFRKVWLEARR
jgi:peptide/nickel transport system substrate-binding protein/oligopeptide transport system substrate-binding protein